VFKRPFLQVIAKTIEIVKNSYLILVKYNINDYIINFLCY
jgi:hypothetical protein